MSSHTRQRTVHGPVEHLAYRDSTTDYGHLFYVGTRSSATRFAVIGSHRQYRFGERHRGFEFTYYPKDHGQRDIAAIHHNSIGPLRVYWSLRGASRELTVWVVRRRPRPR